MLYPLVTMPGPFGAWCEAVAAGLVVQAFGSVDLIRADGLDSLAAGLIGSKEPQLIVVSRQPSKRLRAALVEAGRKIVIGVTDPLVSVSDVVRENGAGLIEATRSIANSCVSISGFRNVAGALVITPDEATERPTDTAQAIAYHFGLNLDPTAIEDVLRSAPAPWSDSANRSENESSRPPDPRFEDIVRGALAQYIVRSSDDVPGTVFWAPPLFFEGEHAGHPVSSAIDITGRPRRLLNGPGIWIEPGPWSLSLAVEFSAEAAEYEFLLEISGCDGAERQVFKPSRPGLFEGGIDIFVPESAEQPIDIGLSTRRAAFDGRISFLGAWLIRRPAREVPSSEGVIDSAE